MKVEALINGQAVSDDAKDSLAKLLDHRFVSKVLAAEPDLLVCLSSRSEYGGSGGIGYFDQVSIYYHGQWKMQEFQWRDRWSASNDRPWLKVNGFGPVTTETKDVNVVVTVELVNNTGKRNATFTFEDKLVAQPALLSPEAQEEYLARVEAVISQVVDALNKMYQLKPLMYTAARSQSGQMVPTGNLIPYWRPEVKYRLLNPSLGVGVFVTQEQIDHKQADPQFRYKLYLVVAGSSDVVLVHEDHAYEHREGSALIVPITVARGCVEYNTRDGRKTYTF